MPVHPAFRRVRGRRVSDVGNLLRGPRRGRFVGAFVVAVLAAGVCWYIGMDVWHSVTVGVGSAAVGLAWVALPEHRSADWPDDDAPTVASTSGGRELRKLSALLRPRYGRVGPDALARVRALARHRLSLRQLDLNDPSHRMGIEQLIGSAAYATLCRPGRWPPLLRSVVHCLDMLDRLDPERSSPAPAIPLLDLFKDSILRTEIRR